MQLNEVGANVFEFQKQDMPLPARVYASKSIVEPLVEGLEKEWSALAQLENVAKLPGLARYALALADIHPGYGFPVGGVAAFDLDSGVVMVGGVGFDINCGVRVLRTDLTKDQVTERQEELAEALFANIPAGLGVPGSLELDLKEMNNLLREGARFIVGKGYGTEQDLEYIEEQGRIPDVDVSAVSQKAKQRNLKQVGTLGSGNHYLEVQYVDEIFDEQAAEAFGLRKGQVLVSIHCGSRGLGHQVGSDFLKVMAEAMRRYDLPILEKELVGAPIKSPEGQQYLMAVKAASNAAFANRQMISHLTRETFGSVFGSANVETLYEVAHNTAKVERHVIDGKEREVLVHRKGSTRGFGPGRIELPEAYRDVGQPIPVGGTMGTASYILRGTELAMSETFGSAIHGAGRVKSRVESKRSYDAQAIVKDLREQGIIVKGRSEKGISEEAPGSYKDVEEVVAAVHDPGLNVKVARLRPLISIKG